MQEDWLMRSSFHTKMIHLGTLIMAKKHDFDKEHILGGGEEVLVLTLVETVLIFLPWKFSLKTILLFPSPCCSDAAKDLRILCAYRNATIRGKMCHCSYSFLLFIIIVLIFLYLKPFMSLFVVVSIKT